MLPYNKYLFKFLKQKQMQCFVDWILKSGLISCWNKKHNTKSYLPANKHSGSELNLSSHTNMTFENCCFVGYSVSMDKIKYFEKVLKEFKLN